MANTLAYDDTATITAVKSFIVQAPGCITVQLSLFVGKQSLFGAVSQTWVIATLLSIKRERPQSKFFCARMSAIRADPLKLSAALILAVFSVS